MANYNCMVCIHNMEVVVELLVVIIVNSLQIINTALLRVSLKR